MNVNEYLDFCLQVIRSNLDRESKYITAGRLGSILRRSNDGMGWEVFGYRTLSDVLRALEERKQITVGPNEKQALAVWVNEEVLELVPMAPPRIYNPLRKAIWDAFVRETPSGRRFFHRTTSLVRIGIENAPSPGDEWVEIIPISADTQRGWAREFVKSKNAATDEVCRAITSSDWFKQLHSELQIIDASLAKDWNRSRSLKVSEAVESWCAQFAVAPDLVFQTTAQIPRRTRAESRVPTMAAESQLKLNNIEERQIVLNALLLMSTEALLELPIPAKYMLTALSATRVKG